MSAIYTIFRLCSVYLLFGGFMKTLSKKWNFCLAAVLAVLGLLIICRPDFFVILLGFAAIAYGVYNLVYTKKLYENTSFSTLILIRCIVSVTVGILAVLFPITMGKTIWDAALRILAIYLICTAGIGFYSMYLLKDTQIEFKNYLYENLALLLVAVFLFLMPGTVGSIFKNVIGVFCILAGVALCVYTWFMNRKPDAEDVEVVASESETPAAAETYESTESAESTENSGSSDSTDTSSDTNS